MFDCLLFISESARLKEPSDFIGPVILMLFFLLMGILFIKYPEKIRKYDKKMSWLIRDQKSYMIVIRGFGFFFLLCSLLIFLGVFVL